MDRKTALQKYQEAVQDHILRFRDGTGAYLLCHAEYLENMVRAAMDQLGRQMAKQGKEYAAFLYLSLLKTDLANRKYRFLLHCLDARWYLDEEPAEVYVGAEELFAPFDSLRESLEQSNQGYGGLVNSYDVRTLLFRELAPWSSILCQLLRYRLRDWEQKGIMEPVPRSPFWILKCGEYRGRTEILIQTERVEKPLSAWKAELKKASREPETMVCSYWYRGVYQGGTVKGLDLRFITFEECSLENMVFQDCNMEGARFPGSRLAGCTFRGCNLWGADLRRCSLEQTAFPDAELAAALFPAESIPFLGVSAEQLQALLIDRGEEG